MLGDSRYFDSIFSLWPPCDSNRVQCDKCIQYKQMLFHTDVCGLLLFNQRYFKGVRLCVFKKPNGHFGKLQSLLDMMHQRCFDVSSQINIPTAVGQILDSHIAQMFTKIDYQDTSSRLHRSEQMLPQVCQHGLFQMVYMLDFHLNHNNLVHTTCGVMRNLKFLPSCIMQTRGATTFNEYSFMAYRPNSWYHSYNSYLPQVFVEETLNSTMSNLFCYYSCNKTVRFCSRRIILAHMMPGLLHIMLNNFSSQHDHQIYPH